MRMGFALMKTLASLIHENGGAALDEAKSPALSFSLFSFLHQRSVYIPSLALKEGDFIEKSSLAAAFSWERRAKSTESIERKAKCTRWHDKLEFTEMAFSAVPFCKLPFPSKNKTDRKQKKQT